MIRLFRLWRRLQGLNTTPRLSDLAREFAVHPRTIYRDLRTLKAAGERVPVSWYREGWE